MCNWAFTRGGQPDWALKRCANKIGICRGFPDKNWDLRRGFPYTNCTLERFSRKELGFEEVLPDKN